MLSWKGRLACNCTDLKKFRGSPSASGKFRVWEAFEGADNGLFLKLSQLTAGNVDFS
jgi:hypothetical protein